MGLITRTAEAYYNQQQSFTGNGSTTAFTLTTAFFPTLPTAKANIDVFVDDNLINSANYSYSSPTITFSANTNNADQLLSNGAPKNGLNIIVKESAKVERYGGYRYIPLVDIVNNYIMAFVGEGKLIPKCSRTDVLFHAKRGIQEFSYDISRIEKIQEVEVPPSLTVPMPQDYIKYVGLHWIDDAGIEHPIFPARFTSRPSESIAQDDNADYLFDENGGTQQINPSFAENRFSSFDNDVLAGNTNNDDYFLYTHYIANRLHQYTSRYGIDPATANFNGVFVVDELNGQFGFDNSMSGRIITIKYVSDGLATDGEMKVHKMAEDALYKYTIFNMLSTRTNVPEYIINRYRKERRASMRNAKLRLSNLNIKELTQVMKGKSKHLKH